MFTLPSDLYYAVLDVLGYSHVNPPSIPVYRTEEEATRASARVTELIDGINNALSLVTSSLPDTMATQLGTLQVDYAQHMRLVHQHGALLTQQLSQFVGLPIQKAYFTKAKLSHFS